MNPSHPLAPFLLAAAFVISTSALPVLAQSTTKEAPTTTVVVKQGPSAAECSARAERAAMDSTGVAGGAVRGGVGGAAVGAIVGGGKGARTGAAAGAIVGGVAGGARRNDVYRRVYDDCMRGY
jgi:outer membrane lipoprotein SlyB